MVRVACAIDASVPAACPEGRNSRAKVGAGSAEFSGAHFAVLAQGQRGDSSGDGGQGDRGMIYQAYEAFEALMAPLRRIAEEAAYQLAQPWSGPCRGNWPPGWSAAASALAQARLTHTRPEFGIDRIAIGNREIEIREEIAVETPFGRLVHFAKDIAAAQPRVLIVAPLSGHFATLLRGTVRTMLPEHDVYITDWRDARDVPASRGWFDLEDFVDHVIRFIEHVGPGGHVVAICQPAVAALAAVAVMAETANPAVPASLTLMAGPIDTRINPTAVNRFATGRPIEWFALNTIGFVPMRFAGAWRPVYPGFLQLCSFHELEPRAARQGLGPAPRTSVPRGDGKGRRHRRIFMPNISRSWICRRSSTYRRSMRYFSSTPCPAAG